MTPRFPYPPDEGGKFDTYMMLKALARNFNVHLFYIGESNNNQNKFLKETGVKKVFHYYKKTNNTLSGLLLNIMSNIPYTVSKYHSPEIYTYLKNIAKSEAIKLLLADHLHMAYYAKSLKEELKIPAFLREHNIEYELWMGMYKAEKNPVKRLFFKNQFKKVFKYENKIVRHFNLCLLISEKDRKTLNKTAYDIKTIVVHSPIEPDRYIAKINPIPHSILFIGNFSWPPNTHGILWFLGNVWPYIKKNFKDASLYIVGKNPPEKLCAFGGKNDIAVTGYVKDIKPWIAKSEVFAVPIFYGGGLKIKILEAMAMGKPVVSTNFGAEGLDIADGQHFLAADTAQGFIQKIGFLFENPGIRAKLSKNAKEFVLENFSMESVSEKLKNSLLP